MSPNYRVLCDVCRGRRYVAGKLSKVCSKCNGAGTIAIHGEPLTFSQQTAKNAGKIAFFAALVAFALIVMALHYFGVL